MLVYPQLQSGAWSQFPLSRKRQMRTIINSAADGSSIKLGDPGGACTEWQLTYTGLSDSELAALQQFFLSTEGSLAQFTFVDPAANLLAWSEALHNAAWHKDPLLTVEGGVADCVGGMNGWRLHNAGFGEQALSQTGNLPGSYSCCFSVFLRADNAISIILRAGNAQSRCNVASAWTRWMLVGSGAPNDANLEFAIAVPAGGAIDVFGPQAEAQAAASTYQTSTTGGVYEGARFRDDLFSFTSEGPNRHSATVNILYANHL
jgi:hypothetical protein